jgi:hypothetical protein
MKAPAFVMLTDVIRDGTPLEQSYKHSTWFEYSQ